MPEGKNEPICLRSYRVAKKRFEKYKELTPCVQFDFWEIYQSTLEKNRRSNYEFQRQYELFETRKLIRITEEDR